MCCNSGCVSKCRSSHAASARKLQLPLFQARPCSIGCIHIYIYIYLYLLCICIHICKGGYIVYYKNGYLSTNIHTEIQTESEREAASKNFRSSSPARWPARIGGGGGGTEGFSRGVLSVSSKAPIWDRGSAWRMAQSWNGIFVYVNLCRCYMVLTRLAYEGSGITHPCSNAHYRGPPPPPLPSRYPLRGEREPSLRRLSRPNGVHEALWVELSSTPHDLELIVVEVEVHGNFLCLKAFWLLSCKVRSQDITEGPPAPRP